jgi:hypothetical protein
MFAPRRFPQAARFVRGLSMGADQKLNTLLAARDLARENKEVVQVVGTVVASVGIVGGAVIYATGWKSEAKEIKEKLAGLEKLVATEVKNLATKEEVAKVETEVKNLATKEEVAKVGTSIGKAETKVDSVVELARSAGENAALRVWKEREASVAGVKASLGGN